MSVGNAAITPDGGAQPSEIGGSRLSGAPLDRLPRGLHCLRGARFQVDALPGGLTNDNLVVHPLEGPTLVVRCFGSDAGLLGIDRDAEHANSVRAAEAGVGAPVVEYRPDLGCLVIEHLEGRTLSDADFTDVATLTRAADAVWRLHAGHRFVGDFDMFARQAAYRTAVDEHGFALPTTYDDHADRWADVRRVLALGAPATVPCNNDLLAGNLIDDGSRVWLIDYEYAGNNDPFFELGNTATECSFTEEMVDAYVEAYLGRPPTRAELARVRLHRLVSEYGWSLWGNIQAATNPLEFDFGAWGNERFAKAEATFRGPRLAAWLADVADGDG